MGKRVRRKEEVGKVAAYISRNQCLRKLQLSLADFRKLCIFKGIYPRSNDAVPRFHKKDILFLSHDPLINVLRQFHTFKKKYKRAVATHNSSVIETTLKMKPTIKLDHIVKERYPTFDDALRDLDDALSTVMTYAFLPRQGKIAGDLITRCQELSVYFLNYIIASRSLKKVFISVKGFYLQAEINGQNVIWIMPHNLMIDVPSNIDFKVLNTFTHLHITLLGFALFKLYHSINLVYPPKLIADHMKHVANDIGKDFCGTQFEMISNLNVTLDRAKLPENQPSIDNFEEFANEQELDQWNDQLKKDEEFKNLFSGLKFYLSRETPRDVLVVIVRSFGGKVSWDEPLSKRSIKKLPNMFAESDPNITHQIVDRPTISDKQYANRRYVQPQWIFDCVNQQQLLPTTDYVPGHILPPHMSPFDSDIRESYETVASLGIKESDLDSDEELETTSLTNVNNKSSTKSTTITSVNAGKEDSQMKAERRNLAIQSMPKKRKRLYDQIKKSQKYKMAGIKNAMLKKQKLEKLNSK